jgi:hypothetical protein
MAATSKTTSEGRVPQYDIAVINASTQCTDAEIESYVPALQQQVSADFAPRWGVDARLTFVPQKTKPAKDAWWLVVLDNSDQAGAGGYHDLTSTGQPIGKVFAASDIAYGCKVSATMSHELLEMLGDPGINMTVSAPDDNGDTLFYAYEACDACEADEYGYAIGDVLVSDFVYPSWFGGVHATQFDHTGNIKKPFEILEGGYIGVWRPTSGWSQYTGSGAHGAEHRSRPSVGSRRERRRTERSRWALSTAFA